VKLVKDAGIDIFRVFDCLNNLDNLEVGIRAVHAADGLVEGAIMCTGDMMKGGKYNLDYYMGVADKFVALGSHIIAIKSMSGVMRPSAGRALVRAIRAKYSDIPIHMHTHDTNGAGVVTMLACVEEGADIVDTAIDGLSGSTSQPAISAMLGALENTGFDAELDLDQIEVIDNYCTQLRLMYSGFDADLRSPDPTIYKHEIPGGQYSNLMFQARKNGLGNQWQETLRAYAEANHLLGDIIKATLTSKAVGDLAQFMVDHNLSPGEITQRASDLDFPASVLDYVEGLMGQPFDGFPEPLRTNALRSRRQKLSCRPGLILKPVDFNAIREKIQNQFPSVPPTEYDFASYVMYPDVYVDFREARNEFGDLRNLPTPIFLTAPKIGQEISLMIEEGKELVAVMVSIGPADAASGMTEVLFRSIWVLDNKGQTNQCLGNLLWQC
jgi:pyruvate carboxylase